MRKTRVSLCDSLKFEICKAKRRERYIYTYKLRICASHGEMNE